MVTLRPRPAEFLACPACPFLCVPALLRVAQVTSAREKDSPDVWRLLEEIEEKETEATEEAQRRAELQEVLGAMEQELRQARERERAAEQRAEQWRRLKDDKESTARWPIGSYRTYKDYILYSL